jgi:hypothetical protein
LGQLVLVVALLVVATVTRITALLARAQEAQEALLQELIQSTQLVVLVVLFLDLGRLLRRAAVGGVPPGAAGRVLLGHVRETLEEVERQVVVVVPRSHSRVATYRPLPAAAAAAAAAMCIVYSGPVFRGHQLQAQRFRGPSVLGGPAGTRRTEIKIMPAVLALRGVSILRGPRCRISNPKFTRKATRKSSQPAIS